ncbi:hypothetical protein [Meridianimarinicoccus aquatilis]|nr:hypothetical protein [Fluviibacterium aquatile]
MALFDFTRKTPVPAPAPAQISKGISLLAGFAQTATGTTRR